MYRLVSLLVLALALNGCGRQSDTSDQSEADLSTDEETVTETMEEPVAPSTGSETDALICTSDWFVWVNGQVLAIHGSEVAELYPTGLPEVGSDEWFMAVDKITGGDGAHGPDGGSAEWCTMVEQRLSGVQSP